MEYMGMILYTTALGIGRTITGIVRDTREQAMADAVALWAEHRGSTIGGPYVLENDSGKNP